MTWALVFTVGAYLVCGIPFGLIVAMAMGHVDVRTVGSGNIGTTNVARSVGKGAAGLTLLLDETSVIELDYDQNTFSMEVSSINFDAPLNILYSWKLEGFYDVWTPP